MGRDSTPHTPPGRRAHVPRGTERPYSPQEKRARKTAQPSADGLNTRPARPATSPQAFPSRRQKGCAGLRKEFYPAHLRDLVDVDYAADLPEEERVWLAAFLEEHYKGYRLKKETQVTAIEHQRAANADAKRPLRAPRSNPRASAWQLEGSIEELRQSAARGELGGQNDAVELRLVAGVAGKSAHELRAQNTVEDDVVDALDERRIAESG